MKKKGVPAPGATVMERIAAEKRHVKELLKGIPPTNAVEKPRRTPEERIKQLEATIQVYEREARAQSGRSAEIREIIEENRLTLLRTCRELIPLAKASARSGKPGLLRLISRIVRSAR